MLGRYQQNSGKKLWDATYEDFGIVMSRHLKGEDLNSLNPKELIPNEEALQNGLTSVREKQASHTMPMSVSISDSTCKQGGLYISTPRNTANSPHTRGRGFSHAKEEELHMLKMRIVTLAFLLGTMENYADEKHRDDLASADPGSVCGLAL
ncbi:MADS-box transcription factor 2 [Platanthera zijinensis]|uniref:MADS-box transcription factor 2 n=1 Tax=Platanthera zijinensis TaxID=2320716 RepID=A0AAP0GFZ3_9ASPA